MTFDEQMALDSMNQALNALQNQAAAAQTQKYNEKNMGIQNRYQLEQWNRQNIYNSPTNVANRYSRAGINPYAAMVEGTPVAGIADNFGSAPSSQSPVVQPSQFNMLAAAQLRNETKIAESVANKNDAEADLARSKTPTEGNLGDSQIKLNESLSSLHDSRANLSNVQATTEEEKQIKMRSETALNNVIAEREKWNVKYNAATYETRVAHINQQFLQSVEDYNHSLKMNPLLRKQAHSNAEYLYENALYAVVQKQLASKRMELTEAQIAHYAQQDEGIKNTIAVELKKLGFTGEMIPYDKAEKVINSVANVANSVSRIIMAVKSGGNNNGNTNFVNTIYDDAWATSSSNNF